MSKERYLRRIELSYLTNAPVGVGAFKSGNILLVGEQASDPSNAPEQQAFCSDKGCSGWLNRLLEAENIPEEKLFWVNAKNNDNSPLDLGKLVAALKPSAVLALGMIAQCYCSAYNIDYTSFKHPQYWKRFKSKDPYPLISYLKEATREDAHL